MAYRPAIDPKLCFVLMPFAEPFNGYYRYIIKPTIEKTGLQPLRSDEIFGTRPIIRDIWNSIWTARIVVADVSDKNPNVNYELGMCHTLGVPTILISKRIEDVPFDYRHHRCITYNTDIAGWEATLIHQLTLALASVLVDAGRTDDLLWPYDTFLLEKPQDVTVEYMAEYIRKLSMDDAAALVRSLEKRFGISPRDKENGLN